jgi:putative hydrolase of the HAD superfamily
MVGNSLKSDILPVVELGGCGVYIPFTYTWAHEQVVVPPVEARRYVELEHIGLLLDLVKNLNPEF